MHCRFAFRFFFLILRTSICGVKKVMKFFADSIRLKFRTFSIRRSMEKKGKRKKSINTHLLRTQTHQANENEKSAVLFWSDSLNVAIFLPIRPFGCSLLMSLNCIYRDHSLAVAAPVSLRSVPFLSPVLCNDANRFNLELIPRCWIPPRTLWKYKHTQNIYIWNWDRNKHQQRYTHKHRHTRVHN